MSLKKFLQLQFYYFQVFVALDGNWKERMEFLKIVRDNARNYLEEFPHTKINVLRDYLGQPAYLGKKFQESGEKTASRQDLHKRIWRIILWTLLGLAILFLVFFIVLHLTQQNTVPTYVK